MNAMVDFGLLCSQLGFGSNWYSAVGAFLVLVGFVVLLVSANQKLDAAAKVDRLRLAANKALEEARRVAADANETLSSLSTEVAKFSALLNERDRQIAENNANAERRIIAQRGVRAVRKLREDAMADFKRSDEAEILGLIVETTSLRYAAILIVAGLSAQIAGSFPGC